MASDGVNDAPALAAAEVGVAMDAAAPDAALETADIALTGDDIGKGSCLCALAGKANSVIRQSIVVRLGVKALLAVGVPIGSGTVAVAVVVGDVRMSLGAAATPMRLPQTGPDTLALWAVITGQDR